MKIFFFFFSSRRRHTILTCDWSSDVCSSDLRPRRRLLLARDRYGVKPLFYAERDGEWLFASEIKAIVARRGFVPQLDRQACYDFLGLGYVPEPATGFANVRAL